MNTELDSFCSVMDLTIKDINTLSPDSKTIVPSILTIENISNEIIRIGDFSFEKLQSADENSDPNLLVNHYVTNFLWPNKAKSFLILTRDLLLQQQKAQILLMDKRVEIADVTQLSQQSKDILLQATNELKAYWQEEKNKIIVNSKTIRKHIAQWKLQTNPWTTYKEQILNLLQQSQTLCTKFLHYKTTSNFIQELRADVEQTMFLRQEEIGKTKAISKKVIERIKSNEIVMSPREVATMVEKYEMDLISPTILDDYSASYKSKVKTLEPKIEVPIHTKNGLIIQRDISLRRSIKQWLDSEIVPLLYEQGEHAENIRNAFKMALLNVHNKAIVKSNELKENEKADWNKDELCQAFFNFLKKIENSETQIQVFNEEIKKRLDDSFYFSAIYNQSKTFLPIPLQSTLSNFTNNQNRAFAKIQNWFNNKLGIFEQFKSSVEQEGMLSLSEKIVRYIQNRVLETQSSYNNIFLTKGYISESFWVGRKKELNHIKNIINQWKEGYRGAVILSGQRLSGKSLFGDYVQHQYFSHNVIRLLPNTTFEVQGRRMTTTFDLGKALLFIKKHLSNNTHPLIWIDDIELWRDNVITLNQNVRALSQYIDSLSNRVFFMVSMSNWMKVQLDKTNGISKVFHAEINLDMMNIDEIREAIIIRHGATHKTLVDKKGLEVNQQQFKKMTNIAFRESEGNIGEALYHWIFCIKRLEQEKVFFSNQHLYDLPDFLNPDTALLLMTLMMEKRTNQHHLRKIFGSPFTEKYNNILERLIGVGLLKRDTSGWLEINEVAVNEVGRLLEQKQYMKFHY